MRIRNVVVVQQRHDPALDLPLFNPAGRRVSAGFEHPQQALFFGTQHPALDQPHGDPVAQNLPFFGNPTQPGFGRELLGFSSDISQGFVEDGIVDGDFRGHENMGGVGVETTLEGQLTDHG